MSEQEEQESNVAADKAKHPVPVPACENELSIDQLKVLLETERQARIAAEAETAKHENDLAEAAAAGAETRKSLSETVNAYKSLVKKANPAIPAELISGDNFKDIDNSLDAARNLVSKVRLAIETETASSRIPAGAPPRTVPDVEGLSPREKIQYGINKGSSK